MNNIHEIEKIRQILQIELDSLKTKKMRNEKGQFSTPFTLANNIMRHTKNLLPNNNKVRFLDPAFGTGAFYSALINNFNDMEIEAATGFEIDEHYGKPASELWAKTMLNYHIADFTQQTPPNEKEKYNLIVCNPPYVRHHYLKEQKKFLHNKALATSGINFSRLAGLYCYFIALTHMWMKKNAMACWLIPSEFMDVNYGQAIRDYLLNNVTLLQIHRFDPCDLQFDDALVSSAVLWFENKKPSKNHKVKFTLGGKIDNPLYEKEIDCSVLAKEKKWSRFPLSCIREAINFPKLSDFFQVSRGIATGDNKFFILTQEEIEKKNLPLEQFRPILPNPKQLKVMKIKNDENGFPDVETRLFVLDCKLPIEEIKIIYPELYSYLEEGIKIGVSQRYLCKNRKIWYSQENRSESDFYCTYIGRNDNKDKKPFRFILNYSKAIVSNSYLILYPKPHIKKEIDDNPSIKELLFDALNNIATNMVLDEGRVYGGGMCKIEPKELGNVSASNISNIFSKALTLP